MRSVGLVTAVLGMLFATSAFCATDSIPLDLHEAASVEGIRIPPGEYRVFWEGQNDDLKIQFKLLGVGIVAETRGRKIELPRTGKDTEVVYGNADPPGSLAPLKEIRFHRRSFRLILK